MIPPQELKKKSFDRVGKGYDIAEVDEYLDFITDKYSEVFSQCVKYEKKLQGVVARISEIQKEEETIHKLMISTQKNCDRLITEAEEASKSKILSARETAEHIIDEAREKAQSVLYSVEQKSDMRIESTQKKADALLLSTRTRCSKLLSDFKKEISVQRENILNIKTMSEEFNSKLLSMYKNHLNLLNENTYTPIIDLEGFTESNLFDSVMREIKNDAVDIAKKNPDIEYDFERELEFLKEYRASIEELKTEPKDETEEEEVRSFKKAEDLRAAVRNVIKDDESGEDEDEDIKVFAKTASNASGASADKEYTEKPRATYDSDDYEEDEEFEEFEEIGSNGEDYGGADLDYSEKSSYGSYKVGESDTEFDDIEDIDDLEDDEDDREVKRKEDKKGSKGLFGLFKNKNKDKDKNKQKKKSSKKSSDDDLDENDDDYEEYDYDDEFDDEDDDREDDVMSIFDDLDED